MYKELMIRFETARQIPAPREPSTPHERASTSNKGTTQSSQTNSIGTERDPACNNSIDCLVAVQNIIQEVRAKMIVRAIVGTSIRVPNAGAGAWVAVAVLPGRRSYTDVLC
jgi:hypothetical protein